MANQNIPHPSASDTAALARKTRDAMQSIEQRKQAEEKSSLVLGAGFDSLGNSLASGRMAGVVWAAQLLIAAIALLVCGYAFLQVL